MCGSVRYGHPLGEVDGDVAAADDANIPTFTKGDFVFFLGSKAPFLLCKVTDERVGADGEVAEVEVRW